MRNTLPFTLFVALAAVQLAVPASIIVGRQTTLANGRVFKFRTAPVDPYDPFRGRFVALRLDPDTALSPEGERLDPGQRVHALLEEDEDGFARIAVLSTTRPDGDGYITARVDRISGRDVHLRWPVDRYYLDEELAPKAEGIYWQNSRREERKACVTVRVRRGKAVLEELYIEDVPIVEYVRREMAGTDAASAQ